jgi:hypothetical protein
MSDDAPKFVLLPKAEDYVAPDKAARLMRHCRDVLSLPVDQRIAFLERLADTDKDFDPFIDEADKGGAKSWVIGICIVLDAVARCAPGHINHRDDLEIWPLVLGAPRH